MSVSQNGYQASPARENIHTVTVPGTNVKLPVRVGAAGDLLIWAAARWHREVEPLHEGWNWGWAYRPIRGGGALSNHSSGTAIDLNAPAHGLGTPASASFKPAQIAAVRRIVSDAKGALRWGGDYSGRTDPMHLEINANEAACAAVLKQLTESPTEVPDLDANQAKQLADLAGRVGKFDSLEADLRGDLHNKQVQLDALVADVAAMKSDLAFVVAGIKSALPATA